MKSFVPAKLIAILAVIGILAFGLSSIGSIVDERSASQHDAEASVEQSQAGQQTLLGPVVQRSCTEDWNVWEGEGQARKLRVNKREFTLTAVPEHLRIDAAAAIGDHYRGLFHVNTFTAKTRLNAVWPTLTALVPKPEQQDSRLSCNAPTLFVALMDARGIRSAQVVVDGKSLTLQPGTQYGSYPGFNAKLADIAPNMAQSLTADVSLEILGTGQLSFVPAAGETQVHLTSNWPHPSFGGRFLPAQYGVRANGFDASWKVSSLATTAAADLRQGAALCAVGGEHSYSGTQNRSCIENLGVSFFDPVNPYVLSNRAIKYGMLFVGLTFVAVAMVEVLQRRRVHPIQYLLVGCALSIFFLLLLSLSEHLSFGLAYAAASLACSLLLMVYASYTMGGWRAGGLFGLGVGGLYGALFVLLQQEQTALVMGSLLLFAILAGIMFATRKLDWYGVLESMKPPSKPAETQTETQA